jgi:hypothetical protein
MFYLQYIIVALMIFTAVAFAGRSIYRRSRSFSTKPSCGTDCGCSGSSKAAKT